MEPFSCHILSLYILLTKGYFPHHVGEMGQVETDKAERPAMTTSQTKRFIITHQTLKRRKKVYMSFCKPFSSSQGSLDTIVCFSINGRADERSIKKYDPVHLQGKLNPLQELYCLVLMTV